MALHELVLALALPLAVWLLLVSSVPAVTAIATDAATATGLPEAAHVQLFFRTVTRVEYTNRINVTQMSLKEMAVGVLILDFRQPAFLHVAGDIAGSGTGWQQERRIPMPVTLHKGKGKGVRIGEALAATFRVRCANQDASPLRTLPRLHSYAQAGSAAPGVALWAPLDPSAFLERYFLGVEAFTGHGHDADAALTRTTAASPTTFILPLIATSPAALDSGSGRGRGLRAGLRACSLHLNTTASFLADRKGEPLASPSIIGLSAARWLPGLSEWVASLSSVPSPLRSRYTPPSGSGSGFTSSPGRGGGGAVRRSSVECASRLSQERSVFLEESAQIISAIVKPVVGSMGAPVMDQATSMVTGNVMGDLANNLNHGAQAGVPPIVSAYVTKILVQNLTRLLTDSITQAVSVRLSNALTNTLGPQLTKSITEEAAPLMTQHLAKDLTKLLSRRLNAQLPPVLARSTALALSLPLAATLTHALSPTLARALSPTLALDSVCWQCQHQNLRCSDCHYLRTQSANLNYYSEYYAGFFSSYYGPYYSKALLLADRVLS